MLTDYATSARTALAPSLAGGVAGVKTVSLYKLGGTTYSTPLVTTYAYDAVGNLDTATTDNGTATTADDFVHDYDYDQLNRLDYGVAEKVTFHICDRCLTQLC